MACKPWGHSRKGKTVQVLVDEALRGLTPGQRSKIKMQLSSQDRASIPAYLSPLRCLCGSQRTLELGGNGSGGNSACLWM